MDREQNESRAFISNEWLNIQRKYWDAWLTLFSPPAHTPSAATSEKLEARTESPSGRFDTIYAPMLPGMDVYFGNILKLSQLSVHMMEQFTRGGYDPLRAIARSLQDPERVLTSAPASAAVPMGEIRRDGLALWDLPLDTWRRTISSMLPLPGDFLYATKDEGIARVTVALRERLDRFLGIPAVGYSRESVDQYQHFASLYLEYFEALQEYSTAFLYIGIRSTEQFIKKLANSPTAPPIDSLRKLYDLWVDSYEEVYAEYTMSDEYAVLHGRVINTLIAVKHEGSLIVDEFLDGMNMPTRREVNTMHRRLSELQRQNHTLRAELDRVNERLEIDVVHAGHESAPASPGRRH